MDLAALTVKECLLDHLNMHETRTVKNKLPKYQLLSSSSPLHMESESTTRHRQQSH